VGSVLLAAGAFVGYIIAYKTYGRFLARKLFNLDCDRPTAAVECEDGEDYVPTKAEILFGHHYTSIAGTGPIVGPAIGIIWGWVPALLWVVFGAIFMGAVHDFGALVVSMRNKGRSIGDIASDLISPRVRIMFLALVSLALLVVLAIFCLVIANVFKFYPMAVFPVWAQIPIAVALGHGIYRTRFSTRQLSIMAVLLMYGTIIIGGVYLHELAMPPIGAASPVVVWTILLLVYCYVASVLPVWRLLQPRDYINGHQLFIALGLLALGTLVAHPKIVAPALQLHPVDAKPLWPFLFVIIACGAISGFHSLVGSGTTSKQIRRETDACAIGYGAMLMEGLLAVFVIVAVAGGIGLGLKTEDGTLLTGTAAWQHHYASWDAAKGLGAKLGVFVNGSANMLEALAIPKNVGLAIMGVFVASFAATTLDTATRIQRYVITELATAAKVKPLTDRYAATAVAVITAGVLAVYDGTSGRGLLLWPLFGAMNQLLACLALLVVTTYLKKNGKPLHFTLVPAAIMFVVTGFAMAHNISDFAAIGLPQLHLLIISIIVVVLELWMVAEAVKVLFGKDGARPKPETP
jgi:carbon starvation protein